VIRTCFIASLWAGLLSLDITGFGPIMISQPMIAGPLFGWLYGHVAIGMIVGGIVQLMWMDVTPVGVGIPYDAMSVTLLAVFWASLPTYTGLSQTSQMVLALMMAVPLGALFRRMDQRSRRLNTLIVHKIESVSDDHLAWALNFGVLAGLAWCFIRYAVTYFVAMLCGAWLWRKIGYFTPMDSALTMAAILLPIAGMGVTLDLFLSEEPDARWLARLGFKTTNRRMKDRA